MCDLDTGEDSCTLWEETNPRAKKLHKCSECRREIPVGQQHRKISSLYDGSWSAIRFCPRCTKLWDWIRHNHGGTIVAAELRYMAKECAMDLTTEEAKKMKRVAMAATVEAGK